MIWGGNNILSLNMQSPDLQQMIDKLEQKQRLSRFRAMFAGIFFLVVTAICAFLFWRGVREIGKFDFPPNIGPYDVYCQSIATAIMLNGYSICALFSGILGAFLLVIAMRKDATGELLIQLAKRMLAQGRLDN